MWLDKDWVAQSHNLLKNNQPSAAEVQLLAD
jgi:hypothetical protein